MMSFCTDGDCCIFKFLRPGVKGKHLMFFFFQSESGVLKFPLPRGVGGT